MADMDDAKEKKQYSVTLPVAGSIMVFVEASSKEEAVDLAFEQQDWRVVTGEGTEAGEDWQAMRSFGYGNVSNVVFTEMTVEEDS